MAEVGNLSASKIGMWMTCPFMYFLNYVEHESVPTSSNLVFGKEIHFMLDLFYKKNFKSEDSFANFWNHRWRSTVAGSFLRGKQRKNLETITLRYVLQNREEVTFEIGNHIQFPPVESEEELLRIFFGYRNLGRGILKRFYQRHKGKPEPVEREKRFLVDLKGHKILGFWDRIDLHEGGVFITDYKTDKSSPEKSPFLLDKHPQFTIYSLAYRLTHEETERSILLYHLRSGRVFRTERSQTDFDYLERLCNDVSEGIINERFLPRFGFHCNFCDYQTPCQRYHPSTRGGNLELEIREPTEWLAWSLEEER